MTPTRVYLAGPMTGIPQFNFPAFDEATARLRERGYEVVSPAELDNEATRAAALASPDGSPGSGSANGESWGDFLARDVKLVADDAEGVVVLPGWERSRGARLEVFTAELCEKPVGEYAGGEVRWGERRVTNERTGGQKGRKAQRFELLPWRALGEVAEHYAAGADKYEAHNWRKGYDWSLSFGAMQRHAALFWEGEDVDAETGTHHMAAVVFHALALLTFKDEHPELDDRPGA